MLKRIETDQLCLGMFIHKLEGSWLSHPFWKSKFLLTDPQQLADLRESQVQGIVIDVSKGVDVGAARRGAAAPAQAARPGGLRQGFRRAQARSLPAAMRALQPVAAPVKRQQLADDLLSTKPREAAKEYGAAVALANKSVRVMRKVFEEARLGKAVKAAALEPMVDEISSSVQRNPHAFTGIARLKKDSEFLYMRSLAMCALMLNLAKQMNLPPDQVKEAGLAGLLMDLGMPHVPEEIREKQGALTDEEWKIVRTHTTIAHEFLALGGEMPKQVLDTCLHHHERLDGSGYPDGLSGADIGLFARMAAICDTYDSRTSTRPYRKGEDPSEVLRLMGESEGLFDLEIFGAFVRGMGIYPIGSLVRLKSDRLAVVIEQCRDDYTLPRVRAFYSIPNSKFVSPEDIELSNCADRDQIIGRELPESWSLNDWDSTCARIIGFGKRA